jgi:hypothetical protein
LYACKKKSNRDVASMFYVNTLSLTRNGKSKFHQIFTKNDFFYYL